MAPEVRCISCGSVCSVDVESRTASCTGVQDEGEPCPQRYGFRDESCTDGWFGPWATLFGEIEDPKTLTEYVDYKHGMECIWAALRTRLGRLTMDEYHEAVAESVANWDRAANDYRQEKGWDDPDGKRGNVRQFLARLMPWNA